LLLIGLQTEYAVSLLVQDWFLSIRPVLIPLVERKPVGMQGTAGDDTTVVIINGSEQAAVLLGPVGGV